MIEFNEEAKTDNPVASVFDVAGLELCLCVKMIGPSVWFPDYPYRTIAAFVEKPKQDKIANVVFSKKWKESFDPDEVENPACLFFRNYEDPTLRILVTSDLGYWKKLMSWHNVFALFKGGSGMTHTLLKQLSWQFFDVIVNNKNVKITSSGDVALFNPKEMYD